MIIVHQFDIRDPLFVIVLEPEVAGDGVTVTQHGELAARVVRVLEDVVQLGLVELGAGLLGQLGIADDVQEVCERTGEVLGGGGTVGRMGRGLVRSVDEQLQNLENWESTLNSLVYSAQKSQVRLQRLKLSLVHQKIKVLKKMKNEN